MGVTATLLVIDMLEDYFAAGRLAVRREELTTAINQLTSAFRQRSLPVVWIRQEFRPDLSDAFLEMRRSGQRVTIAGTPGCRVLHELTREDSDHEVVKKRYSAFFGTDLEDRLSQQQPDTLVLAGINTHACVRTTAIDAYQRDYDVVVADEGTASHDPEHHGVSKRYLDGKIARFLSNRAIVELVS